MKNKILKILCMAVALCLLISISAVAADTQNSDLKVRVNGRLVEFPDGQPFIDAHDRTLIPVRFVAEELGADVSWDGKTRTAIIKRGGVEVDITIGNSVLTVKRDGATDKVTMDTEAVLAHDRTYVPIRFVAEQLGAFVDYADYYRTVGIYNDVLSKEEIERLTSYPLDAVCNTVELYQYYTSIDGRNSTFANCRELEWSFTTGFRDSQKTLDNAVSELNYHSDNLDVEFRTDASCFYSIKPIDDEYLKAGDSSIRGVLLITRKKDFSELSKTDNNELLYINQLLGEGVHGSAGVELPLGETVTLDVEAIFTKNVYHRDYDSLYKMWVLYDPGHYVSTKYHSYF